MLALIQPGPTNLSVSLRAARDTDFTTGRLQSNDDWLLDAERPEALIILEMKNHGFNDKKWEEAPESVEKDDEKLEELMDLQDPYMIDRNGPQQPQTIEEKYEAEITFEKIIAPQMEELFGGPYIPEEGEPDAE